MSRARSYLVAIEAKVLAEVAVTASSKREAARLALEQGPDSGELAGTPQRLTTRICRVREVGEWPATD